VLGQPRHRHHVLRRSTHLDRRFHRHWGRGVARPHGYPGAAPGYGPSRPGAYAPPAPGGYGSSDPGGYAAPAPPAYGGTPSACASCGHGVVPAPTPTYCRCCGQIIR
jgi:hypothetical protein